VGIYGLLPTNSQFGQISNFSRFAISVKFGVTVNHMSAIIHQISLLSVKAYSMDPKERQFLRILRIYLPNVSVSLDQFTRNFQDLRADNTGFICVGGENRLAFDEVMGAP